jgi:hypothetical protein
MGGFFVHLFWPNRVNQTITSTSELIRQRIMEKESRLNTLNRELASGCSLSGETFRVSAEWVRERFDNIHGLLSDWEKYTPDVRRHLKSLFPEKLAVEQIEGRNSVIFKINGELNPLKSLMLSSPIMYHSGTGNRTLV